MSSSHTSKKGHQKSFKILLSTRHGYDIISNFLLVSEKCRHLSEPRDTVAILGKAQIEKVVEKMHAVGFTGISIHLASSFLL